jgi:YHS domain-containing protein
MRRSGSVLYLGGFGAAAVVGAVLVVSNVEASLPTGGMLRQRPRGPARSDMPASTSIMVYRIPSAVAYGMTAGRSTPRPLPELTDDESVYGIRLPENAGQELAARQIGNNDYAGLKGVCVVTLRDERRLAVPRPELYSMFGGRRYEFATPAAKSAFDADPLHYAPVLEGRDLVMMAAGMSDDVGTLRHAGFYRERLFLFQSAENLREFCRDPRRFTGR